MILLLLILQERGYRRVWVVDTEYCQIGGERPRARCLCALDLFSGERREVWLAGVINPPCPFEMTADECFVFFAADADVGIFINLKWPIPRHVIDPRVEFMRVRNGLAPLKPLDGGDPDIATEKETKASKKRRKKPGPFSLSRIARHYEVPFIDDEAKGDFRDLALRPSDEYSDVEKRALVEYCSGDVVATAEVFRRVWEDAGLSDPQTLNQALIRGFYMSAAAWVQYIGTPIDLPLYRRLSMNAGALRARYHPRRTLIVSMCMKRAVSTSKKVRGFPRRRTAFSRVAAHRQRPARQERQGPREDSRNAPDRRGIPAFLGGCRFDGGDRIVIQRGRRNRNRQGKKTATTKRKDCGMQQERGRNRAPLLPFGAKTSAQHAARPGVPVHQSEVDALSDSPRRGPAQSQRSTGVRKKIRDRRFILSGDPVLLEMCAREDRPYMEFALADHPRAMAPPEGDRKIASGRSQNLQGAESGSAVRRRRAHGRRQDELLGPARANACLLRASCARNSRCSTPGPTISRTGVSPPLRSGRDSGGDFGPSTGRATSHRIALVGISRFNRPAPTS